MVDKNGAPDSGVVTDVASGSFSDLWKKEDYWAIWLGFMILVIGMIIYLPNPPAKMDEIFSKSNATMAAEAQKAPFKTVAWYKAADAKKKLKASSSPAGKWLKKLLGKPHGWSGNPVASFVFSDEAAKAKGG